MTPNEIARMTTLTNQGGFKRVLQFYHQSQRAYLMEAKSLSIRSERRKDMRAAAKLCKTIRRTVAALTPAGDERIDYRPTMLTNGWHPHDISIAHGTVK